MGVEAGRAVEAMILRDDVDPAILAQPCAYCGKSLPEEQDCVVTFARGRFELVHGECWEPYRSNPDAR